MPFKRTNITLTFSADLDAIRGWGHEPDDWVDLIRRQLATTSYEPNIMLHKIDTVTKPFEEGVGYLTENKAPEVFVVRGTHYEVPGERMSLHWSEAAASEAANELVNIMLGDSLLTPLERDATAEDRDAAIERIRLTHELDEDTFDVWITSSSIKEHMT